MLSYIMGTRKCAFHPNDTAPLPDDEEPGSIRWLNAQVKRCYHQMFSEQEKQQRWEDSQKSTMSVAAPQPRDHNKIPKKKARVDCDVHGDENQGGSRASGSFT